MKPSLTETFVDENLEKLLFVFLGCGRESSLKSLLLMKSDRRIVRIITNSLIISHDRYVAHDINSLVGKYRDIYSPTIIKSFPLTGYMSSQCGARWIAEDFVGVSSIKVFLAIICSMHVSLVRIAGYFSRSLFRWKCKWLNCIPLSIRLITAQVLQVKRF